MPACVDDDIERRRALQDFELLMQRPRNYFQLSEDQRWEIDEQLGALDALCERRYVTDEMEQRWQDHFGIKP